MYKCMYSALMMSDATHLHGGDDPFSRLGILLISQARLAHFPHCGDVRGHDHRYLYVSYFVFPSSVQLPVAPMRKQNRLKNYPVVGRLKKEEDLSRKSAAAQRLPQSRWCVETRRPTLIFARDTCWAGHFSRIRRELRESKWV